MISGTRLSDIPHSAADGGGAGGSAPEAPGEGGGGSSTLAEGSAATVVASDASETPVPSAAPSRTDEVVDRWFTIEIVGTEAASQHWNFLVEKRESLKSLLRSI